MKNFIFLILLILGTICLISTSRLRNKRIYNEDYDSDLSNDRFLEEAAEDESDIAEQCKHTSKVYIWRCV